MSILLYLFVIVVIVGIDQLSKSYIVATFSLNDSITIIKDFFKITYVQNDGAGFSILKGQQTFFILITIVALVVLFYLLIKEKRKNMILVYLFLIGGALGNFIDRLLMGYVIDFLDFYIFGYNFPVFNVADSFLTIGCILFIIFSLLEKDNANS